MPKLHLVGITPDNRGLLLSEHSRSKRGDLVLEIDDKLLEAIDRAHRLRLKEEGRGLESAALPSKRDDREDAPGGRLSPREIQHRLRLGESVAALAKASGTDEAWIDRFAPPIQAEQARLVDRATTKVYVKPRVGPSAVPLGQAVAANVFDKGATLTLDEIDEGWGAHMRPEGVWCVTFSFSHKGRRHLAEWDVDPSTNELTARNKLAGELGYRESGRPLRQPEASVAAPAPAVRKPAARPAPVKKTVVKKPAASKVAGKPAVGKPRAGARPVPQTLPGTSTEASPTPATPAADAPGAVESPASGPGGSPASGPSRAEGGRDPLGRRALFSRPAPEEGSPASAPSESPAVGSAESSATGPAESPASGPAGSSASGPTPTGAAGAVSMAQRPAPATTPPAPPPVVTPASPPAQRVLTGAQPAPEATASAPSATKAAPAPKASPAARKAGPAKKAAPARKPAAKKPAVAKKPGVAEKVAPAEQAAPPVEKAAPADEAAPPAVAPPGPAGPPPGSPAPAGSPSMPASEARPGTPSGEPGDLSPPGQAPVPEPPAG